MRVSHYHAATPGEALEHGILPWLKETTSAWLGEKAVVVVPAAYTGHWIKYEAARRGIGLIGVEFLTPGRIRKALDKDPRSTFTESPRLDISEFSFLHAHGLAEAYPEYQDINSIFEAYSILESAESILGDLPQGDPFFEYIRKMHESIESTGYLSAAASDRALLAACSSWSGDTPIWKDVLIYGFGPTDFSVYSVLRSISGLCDSLTFIQWEPFDARFGALWTQSWEAYLGPLESYADSDFEDPPLLEACELLLDPSAPATEAASEWIQVCEFEHSRAVLTFLIETLDHIFEAVSEARVALLYQRMTPEISWILQRLDMAGVAVCVRSGRPWASRELPESLGLWLKFQASASLDDFAEFVRMLHQEDELGGKHMQAVLRAADRAFSELQITDFHVIEEWIRRISMDPQVSGFLDHWGLLTPEERPGLYLEDVMTHFGDEPLEAFYQIAADKMGAFQLEEESCLERRVFFEWLGAIYEGMALGSEQNRERLYSQVQAVTLKEASRESWTHVCVLDASHSHWNSERSASPWIPEALLSEMSRRCLEPSPQGDGEWILRGGCVPYVLPAEDPWTIRCLLYMLFRQRLEGVFILHTPNDPVDSRTKRSLAEWVDVWVNRLGLTQQVFESMRQVAYPTDGGEPHPIAGLNTAVQARYNLDKPFGEFDFSAPDCQEFPRQLAVKDIEYTLRDPASHWYLSVLGLTPRQRFRDRLVRALSEGSRLHRWLQWNSRADSEDPSMPQPGFNSIPSRTDWEAQIAKRAEADLGATEWVYQSCGRVLPDWWKHQWRIQRSQVNDVLDTFYRLSEDAVSAFSGFEVAVPPGVRMGIESKRPVILSGRMDVLLSSLQDALVPGRNQDSQRKFYILDFKSGNRVVPTLKQLSRGDSLQLLLYARALWEMGSRNVAISIISKNTAKAKWLQIDFSDAQLSPLIDVVMRMVHTRTFGCRPSVSDSFSFQETRPVSFTALPEAVIDARWHLTHPEWKELEG